MGKVRTRKVKTLGKKVFELAKHEVSTDFERNKKVVESYLTGVTSKKLRNKVAGYLTALAKRLEKDRLASGATTPVAEESKDEG